MRALRIATLVTVTFLTGCGDTPKPVSDAICADLENGLTPFQIGQPSIQDGTRTPAQTADWIHSHTLTGCPDQLERNEALRSYLANWGINPDAR